jgi:hypothetical protein
LLTLFLLATALQCQQRAPSPDTKTNPPPVQKKAKSESQFPCPDPLATVSCKSFVELYKAGDEAVQPTVNYTSYACFRQNIDEFFIVQFQNPMFFKTHLDKFTGKQVPDDDATVPGSGHIHAFVNGIQDNSTAPIYMFAGSWTYIFEPEFAATSINFQKDMPDTEHYGVLVDSSKFSAAFRYKNKMDKNIDYDVVIQRSTGRFSETYTEEQGKFPFLEHNGYCSRLQVKGTKARE